MGMTDARHALSNSVSWHRPSYFGSATSTLWWGAGWCSNMWNPCYGWGSSPCQAWTNIAVMKEILFIFRLWQKGWREKVPMWSRISLTVSFNDCFQPMLKDSRKHRYIRLHWAGVGENHILSECFLRNFNKFIFFHFPELRLGSMLTMWALKLVL